MLLYQQEKDKELAHYFIHDKPKNFVMDEKSFIIIPTLCLITGVNYLSNEFALPNNKKLFHVVEANYDSLKEGLITKNLLQEKPHVIVQVFDSVESRRYFIFKENKFSMAGNLCVRCSERISFRILPENEITSKVYRQTIIDKILKSL